MWRVRVCKWRPASACFLLRDHTLYGSLPSLLGSKSGLTCAGAMFCDDNQDKRYKQRGIRGSLKASVPNKINKGRQRGCHNIEMVTSHVRRKPIGQSWDDAKTTAAAFLGTGSLLLCPGLFLPLCLFRCQLACLLSLSAFLNVNTS